MRPSLNNMLRPLALQVLIVAVLSGTLLYGGDPGIDEIAPSLKQIGASWTSNHIVVYVDQISPANEICN